VGGVRTYRDVLDAYRTHPEPKSLGPDGRPCGRATNGLLSRRPIRALSITHIGKETSLLDEIQAGLIGDEEDVLTEYIDLNRDPFARYIIPILHEIPAAQIACDTGLNLTTVKRIRSRRVQPSPPSRALLTCYVGDHARQRLAQLAVDQLVERDDLRACAQYLALRPQPGPQPARS